MNYLECLHREEAWKFQGSLLFKQKSKVWIYAELLCACWQFFLYVPRNHSETLFFLHPSFRSHKQMLIVYFRVDWHKIFKFLVVDRFRYLQWVEIIEIFGVKASKDQIAATYNGCAMPSSRKRNFPCRLEFFELFCETVILNHAVVISICTHSPWEDIEFIVVDLCGVSPSPQ